MKRKAVYRKVEGVAAMPSDFPARLERLKAAAELSWSGLARKVRAQLKTVRRWRRGQGLPGAAHLYNLFVLASETDEGYAILIEEAERGHGPKPDPSFGQDG